MIGQELIRDFKGVFTAWQGAVKYETAPGNERGIDMRQGARRDLEREQLTRPANTASCHESFRQGW